MSERRRLEQTQARAPTIGHRTSNTGRTNKRRSEQTNEATNEQTNGLTDKQTGIQSNRMRLVYLEARAVDAELGSLLSCQLGSDSAATQPQVTINLHWQELRRSSCPIMIILPTRPRSTCRIITEIQSDARLSIHSDCLSSQKLTPNLCSRLICSLRRKPELSANL